jgi:hypothetical protein
MTTAVNPNLELTRLKHQWWWTDAEKRAIGGVDQREAVAAKAWELLRRTITYPLLYERFNVVADQLRQNPNLYLNFRARVCREFGEQIGWLAVLGRNPNLTWVELSEDAHKILNQLHLPRQQSPARNLPMHIFTLEITRKAGREQISNSDWGGSYIMNFDPQNIKVLPAKVFRQSYVVIRFNMLLGEDSLIEQLDKILPCTEKFVYPALWKPTSQTDDPHYLADDVRLTATSDQPYVLCWIPTCHNLKTVRERFHNQVRPENLKPKIKSFEKIWQREKVTVQKWTGKFARSTGDEPAKPIYETKTVQVYPRSEDLPHDLTVRRAGENDWEAVCAFDYRVKKLNCPVTTYLFDCYRRDSGENPKSNQEKDKLLKNWRNGRAAVARRLQEIDDKLPSVDETFSLIWDDIFKHVSPKMRPKMPC